MSTISRATVRYLILSLLLISVLLAACNETQQEDGQVTDPNAPATEQGVTQNPQANTDSNPAQPQPAPTPVPPSGELTVWHSWAQRDGDALERILQDFRQRYPGIRVETLFVSQNDLLQSYAQAVSDGGGPDIVLAPNWWLDELKTLGVISSLEDPNFAAATASVLPAATDNLRIDGRLYGMPITYEIVAMFYNKSLVPESSLPTTLTQMVEMASLDPAYGVGLYASPFHLSWGFEAFGARIFDDAGHSMLADSPGSAQFLRLLTQLNELQGSFVDSDYGMLLERFKQGEYAFFVDGPWAIADLEQALSDNLGVTVLPAGPAGSARPWLYADAAYVNPNMSSSDTVLAALFIEHLTGGGSGTYLADIAQRLPVSPNARIAPDSLLSGFATQATDAIGMPHGAEMDAFWRYGSDMFLKILSGAYDVQSVVDETAALINDATGN